MPSAIAPARPRNAPEGRGRSAETSRIAPARNAVERSSPSVAAAEAQPAHGRAVRAREEQVGLRAAAVDAEEERFRAGHLYSFFSPASRAA